MKKLFAILGVAAALAACTQAPQNGGPTVFQGRFIGYNNEFVEFFLPQEDGSFKEIPVKVNEDGTFCDTIQFEKNLYDAPLFADKFMFRVCLEQGKTYNAEFDITQEGVETNFRFDGEGAAENAFMAHYWDVDVFKAIADATTFKDFKAALKDSYAPLRKELGTISNKAFVKYYNDEIDGKEGMYSYYFPFFAADATGTCPDDPDFNAYVAGKKKLSDDDFRSSLEGVLTNVSYLAKRISITEAVKAAASCSANPAQKEWAMTQMIASLVGAGNTNGLQEGYDYFSGAVQNEDYLDQVDEICNNALLLGPGSDAPDIEFEDIDGKVFHLADFAGKPLYIDLWASWCGPCCEEIPHLAAFVESLGKDPEICCISISIDDERSDWTKKLEEVGSTWPQFLATENGKKSISGKYFVNGIPRFLLISADGKIATVNAPRPSNPDLLNELKSLL